MSKVNSVVDAVHQPDGFLQHRPAGAERLAGNVEISGDAAMCGESKMNCATSRVTSPAVLQRVTHLRPRRLDCGSRRTSRGSTCDDAAAGDAQLDVRPQQLELTDEVPEVVEAADDPQRRGVDHDFSQTDFCW